MGDINIYGYMRVSSKEQNEDRQKIALTEIRDSSLWKAKRGISSIQSI